MHACLITFLSQTAANRFKKLARENGISISIVQTPKDISYGGCSYAARCKRSDLGHLLSLCRENGVGFSRVFAEYRNTNGRKYYEEIRS